MFDLYVTFWADAYVAVKNYGIGNVWNSMLCDIFLSLLGAVITLSEKSVNITEGLTMLKALMPTVFNGQGEDFH